MSNGEVSLKDCCKAAIEGLKNEGQVPFCPFCGTALKPNHDPVNDPFDYQCPHCCRAEGYRRILLPDRSKPYCPNCGKEHGFELRWPKGFLACLSC